jgi:manganese/iron transport system permease protein
VTVLVVGLLAAIHKELVLRAFDPAAAAAAGYRLLPLDLLLNVLLVLVVVAAVRAVGTVLVLALLVVPAAAARLLSDRLSVVVGFSIGIGMLGGYLGLATSYEASVHHGLRLASGATVVLTLVVLYLAALAIRGVRRRRGTARSRRERRPGTHAEVPA